MVKAIAIDEVFTSFGEGPIWDEKYKRLYLVDLGGKKVIQYEPERKHVKTYQLPELTTAVVKAMDDQLICVIKNELFRFDLHTEELNSLLKLPDVRVPYLLNDAKCDHKGRIWVGTVNDRFREVKESIDGESSTVESNAALYRIEPQLEVTKASEGFTISNGMAWDVERERMYFIDSAQASILKYDYCPETGEIFNETVVYTFDELDGFPDGMTIDRNGMIWVALFKTGPIARVTPKKGLIAQIDPFQRKWIDTIFVPVSHVTSCIFGGEDLNTLYITTANAPLSEVEKENQKQAGQLFKAELEVGGYSGNEFRYSLYADKTL